MVRSASAFRQPVQEATTYSTSNIPFTVAIASSNVLCGVVIPVSPNPGSTMNSSQPESVRSSLTDEFTGSGGFFFNAELPWFAGNSTAIGPLCSDQITLAHPRRPGRPSMSATELTAKLSRLVDEFMIDHKVCYFRRRIAGNGSTLAVPSSSNGS